MLEIGFEHMKPIRRRCRAAKRGGKKSKFNNKFIKQFIEILKIDSGN